MNFKSLEQVLSAFEAASLAAGHARNTRATKGTPDPFTKLGITTAPATIIPFSRTA